MLLTFLPLAMLSQAASAQDIRVAAPLSSKPVSYPMWVRAHSVGCGGQKPVSFGYSIDDRSSMTMGNTAYDIDNFDKSITPGTHTVHFKSWTHDGICPVVNTKVTLGGTTPNPIYGIPSNAVSSGTLDGARRWKWNHDPGTPGSSIGSSEYPVAGLSSDDSAHKFTVTYSQHGGEIYHLSFARDTAVTHFVYDTYLYIVDPSQLQNVELDMNQVMADGRTVIFGTQCASGTGTWEFTTASNNHPHWHASNVPCNPKAWAAKTWHHIQIASHRDAAGVVTYDWVNVDETFTGFQNASGPSALSLGWAGGDLLLNFQLDGASANSGSITAYTDKLTIYRW